MCPWPAASSRCRYMEQIKLVKGRRRLSRYEPDRWDFVPNGRDVRFSGFCPRVQRRKPMRAPFFAGLPQECVFSRLFIPSDPDADAGRLSPPAPQNAHLYREKSKAHSPPGWRCTMTAGSVGSGAHRTRIPPLPRLRHPRPRFCPCPLRRCGHHFIVAYSCKGRGVRPLLHHLAQGQTAAHLVDHVFPPMPVRQWVPLAPQTLALSPRRRQICRPPWDCTASYGAIEQGLRKAGGGDGQARLGAIVFIHRFGG